MSKHIRVEMILETIYGGGLDEKDYERIVLMIRQALDDSFYDHPLSDEQRQVIDDLKTISNKIKNFWRL